MKHTILELEDLGRRPRHDLGDGVRADVTQSDSDVQSITGMSEYVVSGCVDDEDGVRASESLS